MTVQGRLCEAKTEVLGLRNHVGGKCGRLSRTTWIQIITVPLVPAVFATEVQQEASRGVGYAN